MYLKRKADAYLNAWKSDPNRSPLIIKGPRQVGKTETIDYFAAHNYRSVVEINFVEEPKYRAITADGYGADTIVRNISLIDPAKKFIPSDTLIFFDEIQAHPDIATALKFFKIDGKYDVICSGSMLGISYKQIESNSVGYKTDYEMRSLDFEEFLASNKQYAVLRIDGRGAANRGWRYKTPIIGALGSVEISDQIEATRLFFTSKIVYL